MLPHQSFSTVADFRLFPHLILPRDQISAALLGKAVTEFSIQVRLTLLI